MCDGRQRNLRSLWRVDEQAVQRLNVGAEGVVETHDQIDPFCLVDRLRDDASGERLENFIGRTDLQAVCARPLPGRSGSDLGDQRLLLDAGVHHAWDLPDRLFDPGRARAELRRSGPNSLMATCA